MAMSFWDMVATYRDSSGASEAWIMRRAGLNKGAFSAWRKRGIPALPPRADLVRLAEVLRVDYEQMVIAMLHDAEYLPEEAARARGLEIERRLSEIDTIPARKLEGIPGWRAGAGNPEGRELPKAARRAPSTGRSLRREMDAAGEENQDPEA